MPCFFCKFPLGASNVCTNCRLCVACRKLRTCKKLCYNCVKTHKICRICHRLAPKDLECCEACKCCDKAPGFPNFEGCCSLKCQRKYNNRCYKCDKTLQQSGFCDHCDCKKCGYDRGEYKGDEKKLCKVCFARTHFEDCGVCGQTLETTAHYTLPNPNLIITTCCKKCSQCNKLWQNSAHPCKRELLSMKKNENIYDFAISVVSRFVNMNCAMIIVEYCVMSNVQAFIAFLVNGQSRTIRKTLIPIGKFFTISYEKGKSQLFYCYRAYHNIATLTDYHLHVYPGQNLCFGLIRYFDYDEQDIETSKETKKLYEHLKRFPEAQVMYYIFTQALADPDNWQLSDLDENLFSPTFQCFSKLEYNCLAPKVAHEAAERKSIEK